MNDLRPMPPASHVISVMLVDDHKTMLWGLERLIGGEHSGMRVVATASDSSEALELAKALQPDVIVLDLDLGGISSLAILPALAQCGSEDSGAAEGCERSGEHIPVCFDGGDVKG